MSASSCSFLVLSEKRTLRFACDGKWVLNEYTCPHQIISVSRLTSRPLGFSLCKNKNQGFLCKFPISFSQIGFGSLCLKKQLQRHPPKGSTNQVHSQTQHRLLINNLFPSFPDSSHFNVEKQKCQVKYIAKDQAARKGQWPTFSLDMTKLLKVYLVWFWERDSVSLYQWALNATAIKATINSKWSCVWIKAVTPRGLRGLLVFRTCHQESVRCYQCRQ